MSGPAAWTARGVPAGMLALGFLAILGGGALIGLGAAGRTMPGTAVLDPYLLSVLRFTLMQAALSVVLSVGPGLLAALALHRNRGFSSRALILRLFALPFALPSLVGALAMLSLYGRSGLLADALAVMKVSGWPGIYGLGGILAAHVFFNMPLAARLFLAALDAVPANSWRLAAQLGMNRRARFALIEWPALRSALPRAAMLVFMLCMTSFAIVLLIGGGPSATTLEVAIYQALRFDFDPARAAMLTLMQTGLAGLFVLLASRMGISLGADASGVIAPRAQWHGRSPMGLADRLIITFSAAYVALPLMSVLVSGLRADLPRLLLEPGVQRAAMTSIGLAALAGLFASLLALALAAGRKSLSRAGSSPLLQAMMAHGPMLILVLPAIVLGSGWFLALRTFTDPGRFAFVMVVSVNAAMALPFVLAMLRPAHDLSADRHDRLCASLGLAGWRRFRLIDWPHVRKPLTAGFAFAMALSMGDLGVIALFGSGQLVTLPWLLHARMGSYRTEDAAGLALMLAVICLALTMLADRAGQERDT